MTGQELKDSSNLLTTYMDMVEFEQKQYDRAIKKANEAKSNQDFKLSSELEAVAFNHEKKVKLFYMMYEKLTDKLVNSDSTSTTPVVITNEKGEEITKPAKEEVTPDIKNENIKKAAEEIKTKTGEEAIEYEENEKKRAVYLAKDKGGIEEAIEKAEYFFPEKKESIFARHSENAEEEIKNKDLKEGDETIKRLRESAELKAASEFRTFVKQLVREGQIVHIKALKVEAIEDVGENATKRNLTINEPSAIHKIMYWKDNKFNYQVFDGEGTSEEDLIKIQAVHLHSINKHDEAVALLRVYYKDKYWDDAKAEQFLYALLNEENPHTEARAVAEGFIRKDKAKLAKNPKTANRKPKDGISQAKRWLIAWFRTEEKDDKGKLKLAISEKKLNNILNTAIENVEKEFSAAA